MTKTAATILPTDNGEWGFWGTCERGGYDAAMAWEAASDALATAFDLTPMIAAVSVTMIVFSALFVLLIEWFFGVQRVLSGETRDDRTSQPAAA